jgi:hypothetical protein
LPSVGISGLTPEEQPRLLRLLLRRLGSSIPAFRAALFRYDAYLDLATRAAAENRALTPREFQRCFPRAAESDVQLVLFPLLLQHAPESKQPLGRDREILSRLRAIVSRLHTADPKSDALAELLDARPAKTIVFTDAQARSGTPPPAAAAAWRQTVPDKPVVSPRAMRPVARCCGVRAAGWGQWTPRQRSRPTLLIATDLLAKD